MNLRAHVDNIIPATIGAAVGYLIGFPLVACLAGALFTVAVFEGGGWYWRRRRARA